VSKALAAVKSVLSFGLNNGLLQTNPALGVKVVRKSRTNGDDKVRPYTVEEARSILEAASKLTEATAGSRGSSHSRGVGWQKQPVLAPRTCAPWTGCGVSRLRTPR
jgi:hypothetical protein